jgi:hypothetical protein
LYVIGVNPAVPESGVGSRSFAGFTTHTTSRPRRSGASAALLTWVPTACAPPTGTIAASSNKIPTARRIARIGIAPSS